MNIILFSYYKASRSNKVVTSYFHYLFLISLFLNICLFYSRSWRTIQFIQIPVWRRLKGLPSAMLHLNSSNTHRHTLRKRLIHLYLYHKSVFSNLFSKVWDIMFFSYTSLCNMTLLWPFMLHLMFFYSPPAQLETVDLNNTFSDPEAMVRSSQQHA